MALWKTWHHATASPRSGGARTASAFSLVELLTVIFIISILIGILIPSLGAARSAAKKTKTSSDLKSIGVALDLFRNDNERDFPLTNGYPPSFAHPPISRNYIFEPWNGQFPFHELTGASPPTGKRGVAARISVPCSSLVCRLRTTVRLRMKLQKLFRFSSSSTSSAVS